MADTAHITVAVADGYSLVWYRLTRNQSHEANIAVRLMRGTDFIATVAESRDGIVTPDVVKLAMPHVMRLVADDQDRQADLRQVANYTPPKD